MAEEAHIAVAGSSADAVSGVYVQLSVPALKAEEAVTFYKAAFGAEQVGLSCCPSRKSSLFCAELKISGTCFLICGDLDNSSAVNIERAASGMVTRVQVDNLNGAVDKARQAGAILVGDCCVEDPCCGGTMARLLDPFGLSWDVVSLSPPQVPCCG